MSSTLKTSISAQLTVTQQETDDITTQLVNQSIQAVGRNYEWLNGTTPATATAESQADRKYRVAASIGAGGNVNFDLNALTETVFGQSVTISMVKVRAIVLRNLTFDPNARLVMGNAAATQFVGPFGAAAHTLEVPNLGIVILINPTYSPAWSAANGVSDTLKLANPGSATVQYELLIVGTSA